MNVLATLRSPQGHRRLHQVLQHRLLSLHLILLPVRPRHHFAHPIFHRSSLHSHLQQKTLLQVIQPGQNVLDGGRGGESSFPLPLFTVGKQTERSQKGETDIAPLVCQFGLQATQPGQNVLNGGGRGVLFPLATVHSWQTDREVTEGRD